MDGFLDGINESLKEDNPIEDLSEDTQVNLVFDKALLYKNMVAAKADWLYELPQWKEIFSEEELKALYKEQRDCLLYTSDLAAATAKAAVAAEEGFNAATNMKAVHGKPAVKGDASIGMVDPGACVAMLIFKAIAKASV